MQRFDRELPPGLESLVRDGSPAGLILNEAQTRTADLIILACRERHRLTEIIFRPLVDRVLRESRGQVLLVPERCHRPWPPEPGQFIVVPLDGSKRAELALKPALALARRFSASLLLHCVARPTNFAYLGFVEALTYPPLEIPVLMERAARYLLEIRPVVEASGVRTLAAIDIGDAADKIAEMTKRDDVAAVVITGSRRNGLARWTGRSVEAELSDLAQVPILVVPLIVGVPLPRRHGRRWILQLGQRRAEEAIAPTL